MEQRFRNAIKFTRREGKKQPRRKVIIVCEGTKTEPNYFQHLHRGWKDRFPRSDDIEIEIVDSKKAGGNTPDHLVDHALELQKKHAANNDPRQLGVDIWCVFDVEAEGRYPNLANTLKRAQNRRAPSITVAISNPAIEYWFLLHFTYTETAYPDCDSAMTALRHKSRWPEYAKNTTCFTCLDEHQSTAVANARRIRKNITSPIGRDPIPRPYTNLDQLITSIEGMYSRPYTNR